MEDKRIAISILGSIKEPKPDIISEGALLFLKQQIEDLLEKYRIK